MSNPKLSETLQHFEAYILAKGKTENYAQWTTRIMNVVIRDTGDIYIRDATTDTITLYLVTLRQRLRPSSFDSYKRGMKVYFSWASMRYGYENPLAAIPYPKNRAVDNLDMKPDVYQALWRVADTRSRALMAFTLSSMARATEVLQLQTDKANTIKHTQHIIGKGQKARLIFWDSFAWSHVEMWIQERQHHSEFIFNAYDSDKALTYWGLREVIRRLAKTAKIDSDEPSNWHAIRNLGAVEAAKKGMSMAELSQRLGHSVAEVTKQYARYRPSTMKIQSEKFDIVRGVLED